MKKYLSDFSVPVFNFGALAFAEAPSLGLVEEICKLLVMLATLVFTIVKIYKLLRNGNSKDVS